MQKHEAKVAANPAGHFRVQRGLLRSVGENFRAVANDCNLFRAHAFRKNAIAHVFAQHDHACRAAQRPAVQFFPHSRQHSRRNNRAAHRHVRIQIADIVDIRLALQHGHECAGNPFERRIGHGQHHIALREQRARNHQRGVRQIIQDAFYHVKARKIRGARADDAYILFFFGLKEPPRAPLARIVRRPPAQNRHLVLLRKRVGHRFRHFRRGRSVRRIIKIQKQNAHPTIVHAD